MEYALHLGNFGGGVYIWSDWNLTLTFLIFDFSLIKLMLYIFLWGRNAWDRNGIFRFTIPAPKRPFRIQLKTLFEWRNRGVSIRMAHVNCLGR